MLSKVEEIQKRVFDILLSIGGITLVWWMILIAWVIATLETRSNGLFVQKRIGRGGKPFDVYKIKTMWKIAGVSTTVTTKQDSRITKSGAFLRRFKIDELPQLFNVLFGTMSFVGPRPDVEGYADKLVGEDRIILSIRPGITGPASLKYKDEEEILAKEGDPEVYNRDIIWPDKVKINKQYIQSWSFKQDMMYIIKTIRG